MAHAFLTAYHFKSLNSYPIHFHFALKQIILVWCLCNVEGQKSFISIDSAKWINVTITMLQYPKSFFASMPQIRTYFLFLITTKITQNKNKFLTTSLIGISRGQNTSFNMLKTVAISVFILKCWICNLKKKSGFCATFIFKWWWTAFDCWVYNF